MFETFVSNSNQLVYLGSLLKISLFRECTREAILFTILVRRLKWHVMVQSHSNISEQ